MYNTDLLSALEGGPKTFIKIHLQLTMFEQHLIVSKFNRLWISVCLVSG